ncbi:hypothetical protein Q5O89_16780 [Peribacillus frigoritolerans]|nr:hypothetical protein [Peribacillus frigoritolerans]
MIDKLAYLTEKEQKHFYRQLTSKLLEVFGQDYYEDETDLQLDFHEWKNGDRKDYHEVVDSILSEIAPEGIEMNWRDLSKLNYKRWHLCSVCGEPFLAIDKFNKIRICNGQDYKRYKIGNENREGSYYKATEKGKSVCFMTYKASKANL